MRLVGSGLGRSRGSGSSAPSFHTRLPSLRKGKDRVSEALGERRGERRGGSEGDVGSAMSTRKHKEGPDVVPGCRLVTIVAGLPLSGTLALITRSALSLQVCQEASRIGWDRGQGTASELESAL